MSCFPERIDFLHLLKKMNNKLNSFDLKIKNLSYESGNISFYELLIINTLVKIKNPKRVLEIGTFNGRTTRNIASNIFSVHQYYDDLPCIHTVDLPLENKTQEKVNTHLQIEDGTVFNVDERGFIGRERKLFEGQFEAQFIHQVWSDSALLDASCFPEYSPEDVSFDFVFIDGSHSYEYAKSDTLFALKHIKECGIILWHDYGCGGTDGWPGVVKWIHEYYYNMNEEKKKNIFHIEGTSIVIQLF